MNLNDTHPESPYTKDSLKDPFEINLFKRSKSMGITFPAGSSIKIHRKKETIEFVNTAKNHERILYFVKNHEIYSRDLIIKSKVKVFDISDKKLLTKINKKFNSDEIKNLDGLKEVNSFLLKSFNNKEGKLKVENNELSVKATVNSLTLTGEFTVKLILDKGVQDKEIFFHTTFMASVNDPQTIFFSNNAGELKCAVFEFEFKELNGKRLKVLEVFAPKPQGEEKVIRLYKLLSVKDDYELDFIWKDNRGLVRQVKDGWKWNPHIKTLTFLGTKSMLAEADKEISKFLKLSSNLHLSVKIIDIKGEIVPKNPFLGMTLDEIKKISDSKKTLKFLLNASMINKKEIKFSNDYEIIENADNEMYKGTLFNASIVKAGAVICPDIKFFKKLSSASNEDELSFEIRYSVYSGKALVLQLSGDLQEHSRFLVLEVSSDD
ncbi:MAG: hypothetical protein NE328_15700 [Lentisphaeraceae bacterium]|nr:hypothetical protein [Lentisphaeraceae bacterium]